jgi:hypothetical protein
MLKVCEEHGAYDSVYLDAMETAPVNFSRYAETVDHVTPAYNKKLMERGVPPMQVTDHSESIEAFGVSPGWRLKKGEREFC